MKFKYIVVKQNGEEIQHVRIFSDFKHLRAYITVTLERELEHCLQIEQALPQARNLIRENQDRKKELVDWTNAKSLADLTDPDEYLYTRAGCIYQCAENYDQSYQIGDDNNAQTSP